jgi:uncharacterized protein YbbC (DUF1343 family)
LVLFISSSLINCQCTEKGNQNFKTGTDIFVENHLDLVNGKSIGLVVNHTSILSNGTHVLDTLLSLGVEISVIFSPEHGFYGNFERGKNILDSQIGNIPLLSLHGNLKKPTDDMLKDLDLIIYDIQDLGIRFYTYVSTLYYVLESAVENNIPMIVLDRPIPDGGVKIEGPVLKSGFNSFLGLTEIPVLYGMTTGELARFYLKEFISRKSYDLNVIEMENWNRGMSWKDIGIKWIPPSPNIPDVQTALVYAGTCFLEGINISEGRGTKKPFIQFGAPFVSSEELINEMSSFVDETFNLYQVSFSPRSLKGQAENPKYVNEICYGISIKIKDELKFNAVAFGVNLIYTLHKLYPDELVFDNVHFDLLAGTDQLRKLILTNHTPEYIINSWQENLDTFRLIREMYLLY